MVCVSFQPEARAALLSACIYSGTVAVLSSPEIAFLSVWPPLFLLLFTCQNWVSLLKRLRAPFLFIALLCLFVPFTSPGNPHPVLGQFGVSENGFRLAQLICFKCLALCAAFSALIAPLSTSALAAALYALHCPAQIAAMFLLMDMNLHIIKKEWERLKVAAMLRGFAPASNMRTYRTYAALLALWLLRAVERAQKTHEGMLLRGFDGRFPIVQLPRAGGKDILFVCLTLCMAAALLAGNFL